MPLTMTSTPLAPKETISMKAVTLVWKSRSQQRMPLIRIRFEMISQKLEEPNLLVQLLQVASAPHITTLPWSAISFKAELSMSSPTFQQQRSTSQPFIIDLMSFQNCPEFITPLLQYFLQFIASSQPASLATLHFQSLPAMPQMFRQPNLRKYSVRVNPTPPATEDIRMFSSSFVFFLPLLLLHISKGRIYCLMDQKDVKPVGPQTVKNLYPCSYKSYGQVRLTIGSFLMCLISVIAYSDHSSIPITQSPACMPLLLPAFGLILTIFATPKPGMLEPGFTGSRYDLAPEIHVLRSGSRLTQQILISAEPSATAFSSISALVSSSKQERSFGKSLEGNDFSKNLLNLIKDLLYGHSLKINRNKGSSRSSVTIQGRFSPILRLLSFDYRKG